MKDYGYDGPLGSEEKEESIDDILRSIRGIVYPEKGTFREPIVDLNRPVRDELDSPPKTTHHSMAPETQRETQVNSGSDAVYEPMNAAVHAVSSFIHVVRRTNEQSHPSDLEQNIRPLDERDTIAFIQPEKTSATPAAPGSASPLSLEMFLRQTIEPALSSHLGKTVDARLREVINEKVDAFAHSYLETWIAKNAQGVMEKWLGEQAPSLVIKCVEVYLKQITKACSSS